MERASCLHAAYPVVIEEEFLEFREAIKPLQLGDVVALKEEVGEVSKGL
jgi:hypothetical protein